MPARTKLSKGGYVTIGEGAEQVKVTIHDLTRGDFGGVNVVLELDGPKHIKFGFPNQRGNDANDKRNDPKETDQATEIERQRQLEALWKFRPSTQALHEAGIRP